MNVKYFKDTGTALQEFSDAEVDETREISANVCVDLDNRGNLVSMTIEHAVTTVRRLMRAPRSVSGRRLLAAADQHPHPRY
jgi:uncharacterized protein YuzE